jgi:tRNA nucleotidyltransferase (CCA-adding enzyme)
MHIILGHENADFDALAAVLAARKLNPDALAVLPERQNRNVATFLALYMNGLPFVRRADVDMAQVERITLVDTQRLPAIRNLPQDVPVLVIDHHPVKDETEPRYTLTGEVMGSTTTLLVEQLQARQVPVEPLEATLMALGIYEDTGSLTYGGTTPRDLRAAAWLVEQHAALDTVRRFLEPPMNDTQQALFEKLIANSVTRTLEGYAVVVAAARVDEYIPEISSVAHRLRETLDPAALFVLVQMPTALHLVCRSTNDAVDSGTVARAFGGGGHGRAAAASLHDISFEQAYDQLWQEIERAVKPAVRVVDLMSRGVQTVDPTKTVGQLISKLRRIGHEGFPVVENGRVIGLLTRRDADRAMEHGLGNMTVRDIMTAGEVTLHPDDSVATLETTMVESGWGQVPVADSNGKLLGIVTRTDLINHWASQHPRQRTPDNELLTLEEIAAILGDTVARLIEVIASHAQEAGANLYMVGGVVRDLLLNRSNLDVDFVVEGDAIALANALHERYGGAVSSFRPFGTAKWTLTADVAQAMGILDDQLPETVDFATARNEFYEHPTALPTVYSGSIKLDLARRDFTINTLAVQLSPALAFGRILDFFGGVADLRAGRIAVLHNLSFVDDPTRMLRAVRFEQRLDFQIETRTAELMQTALPMLRRITGERIRNELTMILRERVPEKALAVLHTRGLLSAIHPQLRFEAAALWFAAARDGVPPWPLASAPLTDLYWHLIGVDIGAGALPAVNERLLMPHGLAASMLAAARLAAGDDALSRPDALPSQIDTLLKDVPDVALYAVWITRGDARVRDRLRRYIQTWRAVRPHTDGHTLKARGLKPGPCYTRILQRLRAARLDGDITDDEAEARLLDRLLEEDICNDRP